MKKTGFVVLCLFMVLLCGSPFFLNGAIPAAERAALIALYNSTNGDNWHDKRGWKDGNLEEDGFAAMGTENSWYGVAVADDHVRGLAFWGNNLTGSLPPEIGNFPHLDYLQLKRNFMSGAIPAELGNLTSLTILQLEINKFPGEIPPELGKLSNLEELFIQDATLSGSIPPELGNLNNVISLHIQGAYLEGSIPSELGNLSNLGSLSIVCTRVTGGIPASIGKLSNLRNLYISGSRISGPLPPELGNITHLAALQISTGNISGTIPPELGNLTDLNTLELNYNQLSGSIPPELGNLVNLESLGLSCNLLEGPVPPELGNLTKLNMLSLGWNRLYTDDENLGGFLDALSPLWWKYQTVAPVNLSAEPLTSESVRVKWNPIAYHYGEGGYQVYYSLTSGGPWTYAGMTEDKDASSYAIAGLTPGSDYYVIVKTQTNANTSCIKEDIVSEAGEELLIHMPDISVHQDQSPFGTFETPESGTIPVSGSIAVTGWALDDISVESVKIYYLDEYDKIYIGDAIFVEGARPDVQAAHPEYPNNNRAGWGYMMLTHFLPNGGNGTCKLQAVAGDYLGNQTILGTKTIVVDNANAVKPFGAVDTPKPGSIASGSRYINYGWALTPQPNLIPYDGQTITVWVDGLPLGHPGYNVYRDDIATLLPGYRNSNGAMGYFHLDTTRFANGVHTIAWSVRDDAGNTDGIGSRYFSIYNAERQLGDSETENRKGKIDGLLMELDHQHVFHLDEISAVGVVKGFQREVEPQPLYPGVGGKQIIHMRPLERVAIHLINENTNDGVAVKAGYLLQGNQLKSLAIGSTLDCKKGIFYWYPGPGFAGRFPLVFISTDAQGNVIQKHIQVNIE